MNEKYNKKEERPVFSFDVKEVKGIGPDLEIEP